MLLELVPEEVAEQAVIAVRTAMRIERDHEEVVSLEPPQSRERSRRSECRVAQRSAHGVQHRRAAQPRPGFCIQRLQQLRPHVVGDRRLGTPQSIRLPVLSADRSRESQPQVGRRRPPLRSGQKAGDLLWRDWYADRRGQRFGIRLVQCQLRGAELQQVTRGAKARVREREHLSRGHCQAQARWQAEHEVGDDVKRGGLVEMVRVIEHQDRRSAPRPDRLHQGWQERGLERSSRRREQPQKGRVQWLHAVEGGRDRRDQLDGVVVASFEGDVSDIGQLVGPLTKERGLAVSGRRHDGHHRGPVGKSEEVREPGAGHHRRRRRWQRELRAEDGRSHRWVRGRLLVLLRDLCRHRPSIETATRG